jgi:hypothetical protein
LRTGNVGAPVKLVCLVAAHNEDVTFVNNDDFALADLFVENFETRPFEAFKIIECMLI